MWKKSEDEEMEGVPARPAESKPVPRSEPTKGGGQTDRATVGRSITVKGDISGDEDLYIQGSVDGSVNLAQHNVIIGTEGRVSADVHGRTVTIHGKVEGDLFGEEQVILRPSCRVRGNITAPRVTLEDGANFRGMIDMETKPRAESGEPRRPAADQPSPVRMAAAPTSEYLPTAQAESGKP